MSGLLNQALAEGSITLKAKANDWKQAIELAGSGLVQSGRTTPSYTQAMIQAFEELGPYMVIAPNIALAHARPGASVKSTGLSLVTLRNPVEFGSKRFDPVKIVVGLAAVDHDGHIDLMAALSELLMDVINVNFLLQADKESDVRALLG